MTQNRILTLDSAALILAIFIANLLALRFSWYFYHWWFDMPMHFLGGAWIAYTWLLLSARTRLRLPGTALAALLSTLAIGLLWEVFEFGVGEAVRLSQNPITDSASDLFFDLSGAAAGVLYFRFRSTRGASSNPPGAVY